MEHETATRTQTFIEIFDHILDRLEKTLPKPVSRASSVRKASIIVGFMVGLTAVGATQVPPKYRMVLIVVVLALLAVMYKELQDYFYMRDVYVSNAQHFLNVRWIPRYLSAFKGQ